MCGRGFNAFPNYDTCCARQRGNIGFHPEGCTNLNATVRSTSCTVCCARIVLYAAQELYCTLRLSDGRTTPRLPLAQSVLCPAVSLSSTAAAFIIGNLRPAHDFPPPPAPLLCLQLSCWVVGTYHPTQTCKQTTEFDICNRNW